MSESSICEIAIEILQRTNDGNDLSPEHLKLVENAVNGLLAKEGETEFYLLWGNVQTGYKKPWLQGIKPFTIDQQGYIYWKEYQIEHFEMSYAYSPKAKDYLIELNQRCQYLEDKDLPVNVSTAVMHWKNPKDWL